MNAEHRITIHDDGRIAFVYSDALAPLVAAGDATIVRASHVEPAPGGWQADMTPSGGGLLPVCALRADALAAEVAWLREHRGL
jgi:hypothetical protein